MCRFRNPTQSLLFAAGVSLAIVMPHHASAYSRWAYECDRLAAHPLDSARPDDVDGVEADDIDIDRALTACKNAHYIEPGILRIRYQYGRVLDKAGFYRDGAREITKAALGGYPMGKFALGGLAYNGRPGFAKSLSAALYAFEAAAQDGLDSAKKATARMYDKGEGLPSPDRQRAVMYWRQLAANGDAEARDRIQGTSDNVQVRRAAPPVFTAQPAPAAKPAERVPTPAPQASERSTQESVAANGSGRSWTSGEVVAAGVAGVAGAIGCWYSQTCSDIVGGIAKDVVIKSGSEYLRGKN